MVRNDLKVTILIFAKNSKCIYDMPIHNRFVDVLNMGELPGDWSRGIFYNLLNQSGVLLLYMKAFFMIDFTMDVI